MRGDGRGDLVEEDDQILELVLGKSYPLRLSLGLTNVSEQIKELVTKL